MESFLWNLSLVVVRSNGTSLSGRSPTLWVMYMRKFKSLKWSSKKLRGIADTPFGLKKFLSYIDNRINFWLKPSSEKLSILDWENIWRHASRSTGSQEMPQFESNKLHSQMHFRDVSEKPWEISERSPWRRH